MKKNLLIHLIDEKIIEKIFPFNRWKRTAFQKILMQTGAFLFLIIALAGPQIGKKLQEIQTRGSTVFILFDCSDSMLAEDFKPTRLEKSKRLLTGLLEKFHGDRVGIIAFAGEAYVYCPVTFDLSTVKQFLKSIEPGMIPQPGTRIGSAIRLALNKMPDSKGSKTIVLLTDGEDHQSDPTGALEEAEKMDVKIFAVGIGNPEGEPIPVRDSTGKVSGYKKDKKGEIILSRLGEETLAKISLTTGGSYFRASDSEQEIDLLAEKIDVLKKDPLTKKQNSYENRYQWFLLFGLILWFLSESIEFLGPIIRRRKFFLFFFILFASYNMTGSFLYADTFKGRMNQGNRFYKRKNYSDALQNYEKAGQISPSDIRANFNKGTALYRLKEWDGAKEEFQKSSLGKDKQMAAKSLYNLGNSYFQKGQYGEAVQSYQQSLKLNPTDPDAKFNLQLALQFQKNPPPQKKQSKDDKKGQKDQKDKKQQESESQKKEREENAKRILKGAANDQNNKPLFKIDKKENKKEYEEDW